MSNYRKSFFDSLADPTTERQFMRPFGPSAFGMGIAQRIRHDIFHDAPYIAMQYRTGRTLTRLRDLAQGHSGDDGVREVVAAEYRTWLFSCAGMLIDAAHSQVSTVRAEYGLGAQREVGVFLASDMYNDGWKNGEYETEETRVIMADLQQHFERELPKLSTFDPARFGVTQDIMGLSAVVDASVTYAADRFIGHHSSSMAWYVGENRKVWRNVESTIVECSEPENNNSVVARIEQAVKQASGA